MFSSPVARCDLAAFLLITAATLVAASAGAATVTLPAVASVHGSPPTFFHSDVSIFNTSTSATATVTATYRCMSGQCGNAVQSFTIPPRTVKVFEDVVVSLFAAPETSGAVELDSNQEIVVTSRLYTPSRPAPTVGQYIPGLKPSQAYRESVLTSLSHSTDLTRGFRTNVGIYNGTDLAQSATFTLTDEKGVTLGETTRQVAPRQVLQINNIFVALGITRDVANARCLVRASVDRLFAYASVIDNQSQDPIFIAGENDNWLDDVGGVFVLPAVASVHGIPPTFFHSDVAIYRSVGVTLSARYRCLGGNCGNAQQSIVVAPGTMKVFDDVVTSLFGAAETAGAVEFGGGYSRPIVTSRLYTPSRPAPTVGQFVPLFKPSDSHRSAVLTSLSHSTNGSRGFRTNVGLYNGNDVAQTVTFALFDASGASLGQVAETVGPRSGLQINDIFSRVGVARDVSNGFCTIRGNGIHGLFTYASVIDNQSQDPIFVRGESDTGCSYALNKYTRYFDDAGGADTVDITTTPGCSWNAVSNVNWLTVSPPAGNGSARLNFSASMNNEVNPRTGTITVAGQTITVDQPKGSYDGNWSGSSGLGSLSFRVSLGQTRSFTIAFTAPGSGCTVFGTVTRTVIETIRDGGFRASFSGSTSGGTYSLTLVGTFSSLSKVTGAMDYTLTSGGCTAAGSTSWSATKQ